MIKQTRTVEVILMRDRLAKWFKMSSKLIDDPYLLTYGRSDNMTDEEMDSIRADVERMMNEIQVQGETAEIVVDADSLRKVGIDPQKFDQRRVVGNVNHPSWYNGDTECIDAMIQTQGVEAVKAFCLCNAFKYLWRHKDKGGDEDIEKAVWYLEKYLELGHG